MAILHGFHEAATGNQHLYSTAWEALYHERGSLYVRVDGDAVIFSGDATRTLIAFACDEAERALKAAGVEDVVYYAALADTRKGLPNLLGRPRLLIPIELLNRAPTSAAEHFAIAAIKATALATRDNDDASFNARSVANTLTNAPAILAGDAGSPAYLAAHTSAKDEMNTRLEAALDALISDGENN